MAQLIKLQDYITRYEWDTYRYPTQFIRLKRDGWEKLYDGWANPDEDVVEEEAVAEEDNEGGVFQRLKNKFKKKPVASEVLFEAEEAAPPDLPVTEQELKQQFLDNLLTFQLKWATSTVSEQSIVDPKFARDPLLKYLLQRLPDTYLLMYYPIFRIKQAPVEAEIILISPVDIEIIQFVELEDDAVIMAGEERTWYIETPEGQRKILNPLISLKRTEKIIRGILFARDVSMNIKKTVISRRNPIIFASEPYQTRLVGTNDYNNWLKERRTFRSPLKNVQIKAAEVLLQSSQSTSVKRPEWEDREEEEGS